MKIKPGKFFFLSTFVVCVLLILIYGRYIEPNSIQIREIEFENWPGSALTGRTIIHISDLHILEYGKNEARVLHIIKQIDPDLVFLTGDYVEWKRSYKGAMQFFSKLEARHGVFAVMGDYDYSNSRSSCLFCHEKGTGMSSQQHKVSMLRDSTRMVAFGNTQVCIAGIDGKNMQFDEINQIINSSNNSLPVLVLSHSPLVFDKFPDDKPVLIFAGDTHGGQIRLPRWLYAIWGYKKNVKYNYGLFQKGEKWMYVTSGIGSSHFKFRLFCKPEVAVFRF